MFLRLITCILTLYLLTIRTRLPSMCVWVPLSCWAIVESGRYVTILVYITPSNVAVALSCFTKPAFGTPDLAHAGGIGPTTTPAV